MINIRLQNTDYRHRHKHNFYNILMWWKSQNLYLTQFTYYLHLKTVHTKLPNWYLV